MLTIGWVFPAALLFLALGMSRELIVYDEGLIVTGAMRVADGAVPHRDFYANYGPGQFYVLAALFKLAGPSILVERAWDVIVQAATTCIVYLLVRRVASQLLALVATGLVAIWLSAFGYPAFPIFPALLFTLIGGLSLYPFLDQRSSRASPFAAGLAVGIATLFRYDVGAYAFAAMALAVLVRGMTGPSPLGRRFAVTSRAAFSFAAGLALICVPVAIALFRAGAIGDLVFDVFTFAAGSYRKTRSLPFPRPADLLQFPMDIGIYLPIVVWIAAVLRAATQWRYLKHTDAGRSWLLSLLACLSAIFFLKGLVRVSLIHMALSIVPALIAGTLLYPFVRSAMRDASLPAGLAALVALVVFALPTAFAIKADSKAVADSVAWLARSTTWAQASDAISPVSAPCHPQPGLDRAACFALPVQKAAAIRFVVAGSRPDETIFVGTSRHDRVFANDNIFYFLAGRPPATKWSHYDPGLQTSADIQRKMIDDLRAAKPRYVILDSMFNTVEEPNDSRVPSGVTLLDDFIRETYQPVKLFGTDTILEPKATQKGGDAIRHLFGASRPRANATSRCVVGIRRRSQDTGLEVAYEKTPPPFPACGAFDCGST